MKDKLLKNILVFIFLLNTLIAQAEKTAQWVLPFGHRLSSDVQKILERHPEIQVQHRQIAEQEVYTFTFPDEVKPVTPPPGKEIPKLTTFNYAENPKKTGLFSSSTLNFNIPIEFSVHGGMPNLKDIHFSGSPKEFWKNLWKSDKDILTAPRQPLLPPFEPKLDLGQLDASYAQAKVDLNAYWDAQLEIVLGNYRRQKEKDREMCLWSAPMYVLPPESHYRNVVNGRREDALKKLEKEFQEKKVEEARKREEEAQKSREFFQIMENLHYEETWAQYEQAYEQNFKEEGNPEYKERLKNRFEKKRAKQKAFVQEIQKAEACLPVEFGPVFEDIESLQTLIEHAAENLPISFGGDISELEGGKLQSQTISYKEDSVKITHAYFAPEGLTSEVPIPFTIDKVQIVRETSEVVLSYKNHIEIVSIRGKIEALEGLRDDMNSVFEAVKPEEFDRWHNTEEIKNLREAYVPWENRLKASQTVATYLPEKEERHSWVRRVSSIGVDFIPIIGNWKALVEAISGNDYISGETLNATGRALAAVAVVIPQVKIFPKLSKVARMNSKLVKEAKAACRKAGYQHHHIIPQTLLPSKKMYTFLEEVGFNIQSAENLIFLPKKAGIHATRTIHSGKHTNASMEVITEEIEKLMFKYKQKGDKIEILKDIKNLVREERALLKAGKRKLNRLN